MFSPSYVWHELRRRFGRTLVTAFGLAAGVGLVMSIIGVSDGLDAAQNQVLSPLGTVGTSIIVTRTIAPTTSQTSSSSPSQSNGAPGGGQFFSGQPGSVINGSPVSELNNQASSDYDANNDTVLTDLAKLGKPGTTFTHDFFFPNTLIPFPSQAVGLVGSIKDVSSSVGALSLSATHESGTVPKLTATFKTGGQTLHVSTTPPAITPAEAAAEQQCIQKLFGVEPNQSVTVGNGPPPGASGNSGKGATQGSKSFHVAFIGSNPAFEKCMTPSQKAYIQDVVVPEQTLQETINPPTTNTRTKTYTAAGVDPSTPGTGLVTSAQVTSGSWFTGSAAEEADEVLVNTAYASTNHLEAGQSLTINGKRYRIVGIVAPTLTGDVSDLYFTLSTAQGLASASGEVDEILVSVADAADVNAVVAQIKKELPGATVLTSQTLADHVTGSLSNATKLADDLGGALAIVVLAAALLIAGLLTLSSVAKRVREIGTLRAIGWSRRRVVSQIVAETLGIGVIGGVLGIGVGFLIAGVIGAVGPGLTVTSTGLSVGASTLSNSTTSTLSTVVHLTAPIHLTTVLIGLACAIGGGLLTGAIGGWRAARMAPAAALRTVG
jgi:ABC-type antimicrobial peptide transport system permease subunit